jgi:hypothetical protein
MKSLLHDAAFQGKAIDERQAIELIVKSEILMAQARFLASPGD